MQTISSRIWTRITVFIFVQQYPLHLERLPISRHKICFGKFTSYNCTVNLVHWFALADPTTQLIDSWYKGHIVMKPLFHNFRLAIKHFRTNPYTFSIRLLFHSPDISIITDLVQPLLPCWHRLSLMLQAIKTYSIQTFTSRGNHERKYLTTLVFKLPKRFSNVEENDFDDKERIQLKENKYFFGVGGRLLFTLLNTNIYYSYPTHLKALQDRIQLKSWRKVIFAYNSLQLLLANVQNWIWFFVFRCWKWVKICWNKVDRFELSKGESSKN